MCIRDRYSLLGGGKRLRPALLLEFYRLCGGRADEALPFACALEMIHTYSLIHDDLPCMDDDDLRRGRATCHKAFDEWTAVLAGDALLNRAYEVMSDAAIDFPRPQDAVRAMNHIAHCAGPVSYTHLVHENRPRANTGIYQQKFQ